MIESDIHERSNEPASLAVHGVFRASGKKITKRVANLLRPRGERGAAASVEIDTLSPVTNASDGNNFEKRVPACQSRKRGTSGIRRFY